MTEFGIHVKTFDRIIRLDCATSLCINIGMSRTKIGFLVAIRLLTVSKLFKNMHILLFDILDAEMIFSGPIIRPMLIT